MKRLLQDLLTDSDAATALAEHGRRTILARHTCVHRVNELLRIVAELNDGEEATSPRARVAASHHR
jgi:spore maturation protein CgeB